MAATSFCAGVSGNFGNFTSGGNIMITYTARDRLRDACYPMLRNMNYLGKAYMDMMIMTFLTDNYVEAKTHYMAHKNAIRKVANAGASEDALNTWFKFLLDMIPKCETYGTVTLKKKLEDMIIA